MLQVIKLIGTCENTKYSQELLLLIINSGIFVLLHLESNVVTKNVKLKMIATKG